MNDIFKFCIQTYKLQWNPCFCRKYYFPLNFVFKEKKKVWYIVPNIYEYLTLFKISFQSSSFHYKEQNWKSYQILFVLCMPGRQQVLCILWLSLHCHKCCNSLCSCFSCCSQQESGLRFKTCMWQTFSRSWSRYPRRTFKWVSTLYLVVFLWNSTMLPECSKTTNTSQPCNIARRIILQQSISVLSMIGDLIIILSFPSLCCFSCEICMFYYIKRQVRK